MGERVPDDVMWSASTQLWVVAGIAGVAALLWLVLIVLARCGYDVARGWPMDRRGSSDDEDRPSQ